ncbi:MAG: hypothetical protein HY370_05120 [Proteobacteria bacterium]|nr:hypothetical protein [Pseudomonadota bacterium]
MVSLAQVESMADAVWPGMQHAVIALPDPRKGEQLVMVTTQEGASRDALSAHASENGITGLAVPATILHTSKMPILGTGKIDYQAVKAYAEQKLLKAA